MVPPRATSKERAPGRRPRAPPVAGICAAAPPFVAPPVRFPVAAAPPFVAPPVRFPVAAAPPFVAPPVRFPVAAARRGLRGRVGAGIIARMRTWARERARLTAVARGARAADRYVQGGVLLNVYTGELYSANVAIAGERIAYVGPRDDMVGRRTEVIDAGGATLVPGYIEPHAHPWTLGTPSVLARHVLPLGTTSIVADNLPLYWIGGLRGFETAVKAFASCPLKFYWMVRPHGQSRGAGESGRFAVRDLDRMLASPWTLAVGEVTRWPDAAAGRPALLERLALARRARQAHRRAHRGRQRGAPACARRRRPHLGPRADHCPGGPGPGAPGHRPHAAPLVAAPRPPRAPRAVREVGGARTPHADDRRQHARLRRGARLRGRARAGGHGGGRAAGGGVPDGHAQSRRRTTAGTRTSAGSRRGATPTSCCCPTSASRVRGR